MSVTIDETDDRDGGDDPAGVTCSRCGTPAPITVEEMIGGGREDGGEVMLTLLPVPDGWIEDEDGNLVCDCCQTPRERLTWERQAESVRHTVETFAKVDSGELTGAQGELILLGDDADAQRHADLLDDADDDDPRDSALTD